ncbi:glycosyltransferase family 4 protein [Candidatus Daviesbacteria bacterium]|nr:glycosyltransferase family 4 protein [Candidatus Daviesbacteria bacterium]
MKIAIDARMYQEAGVGRYIRNLIENLKKIDKQNKYILFSPDIKWYSIKEQIKLPGLLKSLKPDLVHFPHFNVPIFYKGKFVITIHDLIHQHFSMQRATTHGTLIYKIKQLGYKKFFENAIKKAERILVPSNFVKNQLINDWEIKGSKIVVTYEAVDDKILSIGNNLSLSKEKYIFYVGNAHPHKNVEGLIKAFLKLKINFPKLKLVLAGHDHYFWQRIKKEYQDKDIIYRGYVSDEELVTLYKNAGCFVMPSFEEGFGIPLLEAMALGCPVVSSNAGSLPEIGGDAAIYFDPHSEKDIITKISMVLDNENLRKDLIKKGLQRYKKFSWKKMAKQTLEVYESCYSS